MFKKTKYFQDISQFIKLTSTRTDLLVISVALLLVSSALEAISLGLLIPLIDTLVTKGSFGLALRVPFLGPFLQTFPETRLRSMILLFIAGILVAVALKNIITFVSELLLSRVTRHAEHVLRTRVFERYLAFSKSFIDRNKIGALCNLAGPQVINACEIFYRIHNTALNAMSCAVYLGVMFFISWKLTLCAAIFSPPFYFLNKQLSRKIAASAEWRFSIDQGMMATLLDALSNLSLIHAYTNETEEAVKYRKISELSRATTHSIAKKVYFAWRAQDFLITATTAALLAVSLFFFLKEGAVSDVAFFMAFFIALRRFSSSAGTASGTFVEAVKTLAPIRQLLWLFDDVDKSFVLDGDLEFNGLEREIEFRDVSFRYDDGPPILQGVNLHFRKGKMTAIVGPTGSGKTTLMNLLQRFYNPTSGEILADGRPISNYNLRSLRMKIAFVEQTAPVLNATIHENISYGFGATVPAERVEDAARRAALSGFLAALPQGLKTVVGDRGVRLSGGERQRIAIARAILKDPDIFVFDEATSSLDMETEAAIQSSLEQLFRGKTVVVIAHRLATIRHADSIVFLSGGKIIESGTFSELMARDGAFRRQWERAAF